MECKSLQLIRAILPVALLAAMSLAQSPQSSPGCEPSAEVRDALNQLPQYRRDPAKTDSEVYQERLAALHALLLKYPNRKYIESASSLRELDKISIEETNKSRAEYKARHERNPDDPQSDYLYASTLVGNDTPQALKLLDAALAKDPSFAWPHMTLVGIYSSPAFSDQAQSVAHEKAFLASCPASLEAYGLFRPRATRTDASASDKELMTTYASKLRLRLRDSTDSHELAAYRTLWSFEFKIHSPSEYDSLRRQVGQDVLHLRQLNLRDHPEWYETLEDGYKLANDPQQADWAEQESEQRFPYPGSLPERKKWFKEHPAPGEDAPAAAKQTYYTDLLVQTKLWLQKIGPAAVLGRFTISGDRVRAMRELDNVSPADIEAAVEEKLKYAGENGGGSPWSTDYSPWSDDYSDAAETLLKKHVAPERVLEYAQKASAISDFEEKQELSDLFATKEYIADHQFYRERSRVELSRYEVKAYLQLGSFDKAEELLAQVNREVLDRKPLVGDDEGRKRTFAQWLADYWGLMAGDAESRGRKIDAMSFYQTALLTRLDAQLKPAANDELTDSAHRLWTSLNGTEEGWQLWYGRRANDLANSVALTWEKANQRLPPFELADLNNQAWNLAALKGKVTFISFWATWCGPCREELPHLQQLADSYKGRSDIQFITLNMDDNPGLIRPFMEEHQLSLVTVPASNYTTETLRVNGIPQNWIMDGQGIVLLKSVGYGSSEKWATDMQDAIEHVKSSAVPPASSSK